MGNKMICLQFTAHRWYKSVEFLYIGFIQFISIVPLFNKCPDYSREKIGCYVSMSRLRFFI